MNLKALRIFVSVMDEGTLARASDRLHISQPAASRLLSLLEETIDMRLFIRHKKRLVPTPEAEAFLREAHQILGAVDNVPQAVKDIKEQCGTTLRIICMPRLSDSLVMPAISEFLKIYPDVRIQVTLQSFQGLERRITAEQFDLGVASFAVQNDATQTEWLCRAPICAILPRSSALAERSSIGLKDVADLPHIALTRNTMMRPIADRLLAGCEPPIRPRIEVSAVSAACKMVRDGHGFLIADAVSADWTNEPDLIAIPWKPASTLEVGILYPTRFKPTETARAYAKCLREISERLIIRDS
ncbi:MAG: LysR family transcriptional regulator [Motiliproteus sp.]